MNNMYYIRAVFLMGVIFLFVFVMCEKIHNCMFKGDLEKRKRDG